MASYTNVLFYLSSSHAEIFVKQTSKVTKYGILWWWLEYCAGWFSVNSFFCLLVLEITEESKILTSMNLDPSLHLYFSRSYFISSPEDFDSHAPVCLLWSPHFRWEASLLYFLLEGIWTSQLNTSMIWFQKSQGNHAFLSVLTPCLIYSANL